MRAWMSSQKAPSIGLLWRLTLVPVALLLLTVLGSLVLVLSGVTISDDRLAALWVLIAALLGSLGAFASALLAAGSQEKTHALEREAGERLRLEATIEGIKLLDSDRVGGGLAAGALATVTRLGNLDVALRMLAPLLEGKNVDRWTAAWIVDQVLRDPPDVKADSTEPVTLPAPDAVDFAANVLYRHRAFFLVPQVQGGCAWPSSCVERWPQSLHGSAGAVALYALVDLITTKPREWWTAEGGSWGWFPETLVAAIWATRDGNPHEDQARIVPGFARILLHDLLTRDDAPPEVTAYETKKLMAEIQARSEQDASLRILLQTRLERLETWLTTEEAAPPPAAEAPVLPGGGTS